MLENIRCNRMDMSNRTCRCCDGRQYCYLDGRWREWICWKCGNYESDNPAYSESPELFYDIVRKNGRYYLTKYAYYARSPAGKI